MRLLKRVEYEAVYGAGQRRSSPQFAVFFRSQQRFRRRTGRESREGSSANKAAGPGRASRFGISVKKALGGAVVRNRIRRRIREILRRNRTEIPSGWDIVIHPRRSVAQAPFAPLEAELVRLLRGIRSRASSAPANMSRDGARAALCRARLPVFFFGADAERLQVLSFLLALCRRSCAHSRRAARLVARAAAPLALPSVHARRRGSGARCRAIFREQTSSAAGRMIGIHD